MSTERVFNGKKYRYITGYTGFYRLGNNWIELLHRLKKEGYQNVIVRKIPESGSRDEKGIWATGQ